MSPTPPAIPPESSPPSPRPSKSARSAADRRARAISIKSINPASGDVVERFEAATDSAIENALAKADDAFGTHHRSTVADRASQMRALADRLDDERESLGRLLTGEMGKTLAAAISEVEKCAWVCRYYADNAEAFLGDDILPSDARSSSVRHIPLGPILAVMPWNFPFWQVFRAAAPALMAGNVVLLKHASNVPRAALALQRLFDAAGFVPGAFQTLLVGTDAVERILTDSRIKAATVTGSVKAGSAVAATAGRHTKKTVLELGGSDPFIVMPSADVEQALDTAVTARIINNGQSCIAAKRFIVHAELFDRFAEGFVNRFEALTVGDPIDETTDVGPLAMDRLRERLATQVETLIGRGAERLTGAEILPGPGFFFRPGILSGIDRTAEPFDEELFGPVAWLLPARDFDDAIRLANQTRYGLASSLWTSDEAEIERAFCEIEAGATFVNSLVQSDPRLPFGGIKASGFGRELARDGILEFVNRKTVVIN